MSIEHIFPTFGIENLTEYKLMITEAHIGSSSHVWSHMKPWMSGTGGSLEGEGL
jgi:hypothetical protein